MQTSLQSRFEFHISSPSFSDACFYLLDRETNVRYRENEWPAFIVEMLCDDRPGFMAQSTFIEDVAEDAKYAPRYGEWTIWANVPMARSWMRRSSLWNFLCSNYGEPEIRLNRNSTGEAVYQAENDTSTARHAGFL